MNILSLFHPVGDVALSGIPPRRFPPFLAVWGGQTEREPAFLNVKILAARFRVCVGLAEHIGVLIGIGGKQKHQESVVGTDMDQRVFLIKPDVCDLFLLGKGCSHKVLFVWCSLE